MNDTIKIVIDTSVLVAAFFNSKSQAILEGWHAGRWVVCYSDAILAEYQRVLFKIPPIRDASETFMHDLAQSEFVDFIAEPEIAEVSIEDQQDLKFVSCALDAQAHYLISLDDHLLSVQEVEPMQIIRPMDFLDEVNS